jgi:PleD family two-component response regulator
LPADGAAIFCERLLERLRTSRHPVGGTSLTVTASLGLATHTSERPFRSAAELLEAADRAVYASKRAGRNQLTIYDARLLARAG